MLFRVIQMNLLLRGCEVWSRRQVLFDKLEVLVQHSIRRIWCVAITQV